MPELLAALDAFMQEHRRCGDLDGGVDGERVDGVRLRGRHRASDQTDRTKPTLIESSDRLPVSGLILTQ
jgi:hypothetical protein